MKSHNYLGVKILIGCVILTCLLQGCDNNKQKTNLSSDTKINHSQKLKNKKLSEEVINNSVGISTLVKVMKDVDTILVIEHQQGLELKELLKVVKPNLPAILKAKGSDFSRQYFLNHFDTSTSLSYNLHQKYVKKKYLLTPRLIDSLSVILTQTSKEGVEVSACIFMPHYAFLMVKNGQLSFVDLCFNCELVDCSENLKNFEGLPGRNWQNLRIFFKALGFNEINLM